MNERDNNRKRVVVFGATGFVGAHLVNRLMQSGNYICTVVTRNYDKANKIFGQHVNITVFDFRTDVVEKFINTQDIVINCLFIPEKASDNYIEDNKYFVSTLLRQLTCLKICQVIHLSTATVVGNVAELRINEETICNPITSYQKLKLDIENCFIEFGHSSKIPVIILRPTEIFGEYGKGMVKIINEIRYSPSLYLKFKLCILGSRKTHFIHVDKLTHTILFLLGSKPPANPVIFIVADDGPWNTLGHIYSRIYSIIYPGKKLTFPHLISMKYIKFILSIINKGADSNSHYENYCLLKSGMTFETTFDDDISRHIPSVI